MYLPVIVLFPFLSMCEKRRRKAIMVMLLPLFFFKRYMVGYQKAVIVTLLPFYIYICLDPFLYGPVIDCCKDYMVALCNILFNIFIDFCLIFLVSCAVTWQGVITEDVVQLRKSIGAPGMAVLQFGSKLFLV